MRQKSHTEAVHCAFIQKVKFLAPGSADRKIAAKGKEERGYPGGKEGNPWKNTGWRP
jgi:hypothetical protein